MVKKTGKNANDIVVDVSMIKNMRPIIAWQNAAKSGDIETLAKLITDNGYVVSWSFAGDCTEIKVYTDELAPYEWSECLEQVGQAINGLFSRS